MRVRAHCHPRPPTPLHPRPTCGAYLRHDVPRTQGAAYVGVSECAAPSPPLSNAITRRWLGPRHEGAGRNWLLPYCADCTLDARGRAPPASCLLPTAYCLLPPAYCLLPTAYCLLPHPNSPNQRLITTPAKTVWRYSVSPLLPSIVRGGAVAGVVDREYG